MLDSAKRNSVFVCQVLCIVPVTGPGVSRVLHRVGQGHLCKALKTRPSTYTVAVWIAKCGASSVCVVVAVKVFHVSADVCTHHQWRA